jgi:metal-responsive CopG/Arc/MetJ family transcriptional regulator
MDEGLLRELDASEEVKRDGRSAVLRRAATAYLRTQRQLQIRERYRQAYGGEDPLRQEFAGWEEQGVWPDE